ncbi:hypothetical protein [uncultured Pontibacter sp.]|uniref:hypothetical protein n=1 Tax=uncultured Pontibacter sp. TaxID=453356 RepID=UPI00260BB57D|nr:hypothetical protein [uncultured Pontibacter sp.]
MIYLIDEKRLRQENYSWTTEKFDEYKEFIKPIYTKDELDNAKASIFSDQANIVLFHDSFFDTMYNKHEKNVDRIRQDIIQLSEKMKVVLFSGGTYNRIIKNENYASLPVEWIYKNLEFFTEQYRQQNEKLEHLAYGKNYEFEIIAQQRNELWKMLYKKKNSDTIPTNERFEFLVNNFLKIIGKEKELEKLTQESVEVGFFRYRINKLITLYIND